CGNNNGFAVYRDPPSPESFSLRTSTVWTDSPLIRVIREVRVPVPTGECSPDIALVILTTNLGNQLRTYAPRLDVAPHEGESFSAVGYGQTCNGACPDGVRRRRDALTVVSVRDQYPMGNGTALFIDPQKEFAGGTGACHGDSGGPAIDPN